MSKVGKLKMNPVGVPKSTRPGQIFPWGLCRFRKLLTCSLGSKEVSSGGMPKWMGFWDWPLLPWGIKTSYWCPNGLLRHLCLFSWWMSWSSSKEECFLRYSIPFLCCFFLYLSQASIPPSKTLGTQLSSQRFTFFLRGSPSICHWEWNYIGVGWLQMFPVMTLAAKQTLFKEARAGLHSWGPFRNYH